jgi:hypothetical protein
MKNEEIHAVEMTRRIRDEIYEKTKDFSEDELIRFYREKAAGIPSQQARALRS